MHDRLKSAAHLWILGSFAIYAPTLRIAQQVHERLMSEERGTPFGTVDIGDDGEVDWVDIRYGLMRERQVGE